MAGALFDTNVWVAAVFPTHIFHQAARAFLAKAQPTDPALFCRFTQLSFLRLISTPALLRTYGAEGMSNRDALVAYEALMALPQVREQGEPKGVSALWHGLATRDTASPKVWMDAYLAAFAIAGGFRLLTLDKDFEPFKSQGLELILFGG